MPTSVRTVLVVACALLTAGTQWSCGGPDPVSPTVAAPAPAASGSNGSVTATNNAPVIRWKTTPAADTSTTPPTVSGTAPLTVKFNICQSDDADQVILPDGTQDPSGDRLNWQYHFGDSGLPAFNADGTFNADWGGFCRTEHVYEREGTYQAVLSVTDQILSDQGGDVRALARTSQAITIRVGPASAPASCTPITASVGSLNGSSSSSTFETGGASPLPTLGWTNVSGAAQVFDLATPYNGALVGTTAYGNYQVEYDTGVPILPSTTYTLHFDMGYLAGLVGGNSGYSFQLGTLNGGVFTGLGSPVTGNAPYAGNMGGGPVSASDEQVFTTGAAVSGHNLAVRWAQTSSVAGGTSDFFGFGLVTLKASGCTP